MVNVTIGARLRTQLCHKARRRGQYKGLRAPNAKIAYMHFYMFLMFYLALPTPNCYRTKEKNKKCRKIEEKWITSQFCSGKTLFELKNSSLTSLLTFLVSKCSTRWTEQFAVKIRKIGCQDFEKNILEVWKMHTAIRKFQIFFCNIRYSPGHIKISRLVRYFQNLFFAVECSY